MNTVFNSTQEEVEIAGQLEILVAGECLSPYYHSGGVDLFAEIWNMEKNKKIEEFKELCAKIDLDPKIKYGSGYGIIGYRHLGHYQGPLSKNMYQKLYRTICSTGRPASEPQIALDSMTDHQFMPVFKHTCEECIFLGRYQEHDLYICSSEANRKIISARYGNEGQEFLASFIEAGVRFQLAEAKRRAIALRLYDGKGEAGSPEFSSMQEIFDEFPKQTIYTLDIKPEKEVYIPTSSIKTQQNWWDLKRGPNGGKRKRRK
jgi:hypothetical protein